MGNSQQPEKHSWLEGPRIPAQFDDDNSPARWPGEKLGLPEHGPGALASVMRRCGSLLIDWIMAELVALIVTSQTSYFGGLSTVTIIVFFIIGVLSVTLFARTPGHMMLGMGVARVDQGDARVGFLRALARTLLTVFIFPPIIVDSDGRGLHDRATQTAVILG